MDCPEDDEGQNDDDDATNATSPALKDDDSSLGRSPGSFPQWDNQLIGYANPINPRSSGDDPPTPLLLSTPTLHSCGDCHLTWLSGPAGSPAALSHPSQHTSYHEYAGTRRSLFVFVDGACSSNGLHTLKPASAFVLDWTPPTICLSLCSFRFR